MAAAQIEANRRNAQKSTGPKSDTGKASVRGNALKHGMTAVTILPGLPQEDPQRLDERTERYLNDFQPRNAAEFDLTVQAASLSLAIDSAERVEMAHLAGRVREAERERTQQASSRRLEEVLELGRGCCTSPGRKRSRSKGSRSGPTTRGCSSASWKQPPRAAAGCAGALDGIRHPTGLQIPMRSAGLAPVRPAPGETGRRVGLRPDAQFHLPGLGRAGPETCQEGMGKLPRREAAERSRLQPPPALA